MNNNFIAAIVLGSSKLTGIVGSKENDGSISVKAHFAINSSDFISKGRVMNVDKMTAALTNLKVNLESQTDSRIKCFYVAINCMGLRSKLNKVTMQMPSSEIVTDELIASIGVRNKEGRTPERDIIEAIPLEYRLGSAGTQVTLDPKGAMTDRIETHFLNVICGTKTLETIISCFRKAGIDIADGKIFVGGEMLASIMSTEQERSSGCVFVDMGSETTTVAVYRGKLLRHLCVIPLGSATITHDIANVFNVENEEAESLKLKYGCPNFETLDEKEEIKLRDGGRKKKAIELAEIIDARVEEIIQNVKAQIEYSGYSHDNLVNGILVCGGGAQLKGMHEAMRTHFKEWNVRIMKHSNRLKVNAGDNSFNESGIFNIGLALIDNNITNCYGGPYTIFAEDEEDSQGNTGATDEAKTDDAAQTSEPEKKEAEKPAESEPEKPKGPAKPGKFKTMLRKIKKACLDIVAEPTEEYDEKDEKKQ